MTSLPVFTSVPAASVARIEPLFGGEYYLAWLDDGRGVGVSTRDLARVLFPDTTPADHSGSREAA